MKSAKECVTTHLPNELVLKMDGVAADCQYTTIAVMNAICRRVHIFRRSLNASLGGEVCGADLGCSSNYSITIIED